MREWFEKQVAAGLPALAGSRLSGTLAVAPALLNELIAGWLTSTGSSGPPARFDIGALRGAVKSLSVRAEPDRILVDVEIRL
jgi:hypothetical protein